MTKGAAMGVRRLFREAVDAHRRALWHLERARQVDADGGGKGAVDRHRSLIDQLARAGAAVTPGWLGLPLARAVDDAPLGSADAGGAAVRVGECAAADSTFPVVVNLLGTGHLAVDVDAAAARGLAVDVTLRLLAARPSQTLGVWVVAPGPDAFAALEPLADAGLVASIARDRKTIDAVLSQAETQVRQASRRRGSDLPERLLVAALGDADASLRHRLARLAEGAAGARVHLVLTGWRDGAGTEPLPATTYVTVGATVRVAGVPLPVTLDEPAGSDVVAAVTARLIANATQWTVPEG